MKVEGYTQNSPDLMDFDPPSPAFDRVGWGVGKFDFRTFRVIKKEEEVHES